MLKLTDVNKYFFKGKKNQIHVIDNTSLDFAASGMTALLGPSGCGKTTLLNAIGGLDKINSGDIVINGMSVAKAGASKKDAVRNEYIGYIFQNYNLVEDMTVFDNVAVVLKMQGIKDKKEIEEKVNYVLEKVGMYRYRKRYAGMLSGGERQRVGIARAIVKNPPIIIADEPTGNLDSRNTLEVMNIIKAISRDKLVILVTHEENLANFYADRIIRIKDGKVVSDHENDHEKGLDYVMDNRIYLGDMKREESCESDIGNIKLYSNDEQKANIDIVVKNGNIYIRSNDPSNRIEVVDENSSMEIVEGKYHEMTKEEQEAYQFDSQILEHKAPVKYTSTITFGEMIKGGIKKVAGYSRTKKILLAGFLVAAMFITYAVSNFLGLMNPDDRQFVDTNRDYLKLASSDISIDDYLQYENDKSVAYALPGDSKVGVSLVMDRYLQTVKGYEIITGSLSDQDTVENSQIIAGKKPSNEREIMIDERALEPNFTGQEGSVVEAGYKKKTDLVGAKVNIGALGEFTISGIVDRGSPAIYADRDMFQDIIANSEAASESDEGPSAKFVDYASLGDNITLKEGKFPQNDYEVMVDAKNSMDMEIGSTIGEKINGRNLKVTGFFTDNSAGSSESEKYLVNEKMQKYHNIEQEVAKGDGMIIFAKDKQSAVSSFEDKGVNLSDTYELSKDKYESAVRNQTITMLIMAAVMFAISVIEIYLIMRASFLSRIKEVGVYRAIGMKKMDVYKMFTGEILAISTIAGLPGMIFMCYVLYKLTSVATLSYQFMFNPFMIVVTLLLIYGINLLFGLLPVWRTVRKTPAEILARTDI